jgi:hypothetical protein
MTSHGLTNGRISDTRFAKGRQPYNKGKKGLFINSGQFKSGDGHISPTILPVGTERTENGYVTVKVAEPNVWKKKAVVVWEAANGKSVPAGHVVVFVDQDNLNFDPDNLCVVPKRRIAVMGRLGLFSNDRQLLEAGSLVAGIKIAINDLRRHRGGQ